MHAIFMGALIAALSSAVGSLVGRVLIALGLGFITYKGADVAITFLYESVKTAFQGAPATVVNFLAFLWVDKALSLIFSAFTVAMTIKTAASGLTRLSAMKK